MIQTQHDEITQLPPVNGQMVKALRDKEAVTQLHPYQDTSGAIGETGFKEMDRLGKRSLGRVPTHTGVHCVEMPYLHVLAELFWQIPGNTGIGA